MVIHQIIMQVQKFIVNQSVMNFQDDIKFLFSHGKKIRIQVALAFVSKKLMTI